MSAPLPAGPATDDAVAEWLGLPAGSPERAHVPGVVRAVNALISGWHSADAGGQWAPPVTQGAIMLAGRIVRRRNSPAGVEALGELGPTYVQRNDPDIAVMLGLGSWRPLVAG